MYPIIKIGKVIGDNKLIVPIKKISLVSKLLVYSIIKAVTIQAMKYIKDII